MPPIEPKWLGFWLGFFLSAILAYPVYLSLIRLKSRQTISAHAPEGHAKKQGTPTMGGIIIVLACLLANGLSFRLPSLVLLGLFGFIGFADDFLVPKFFPGTRGLGWKQKLIMQAAAAAIVLAMRPPGGLVPALIAGFLILFFSNAYNFSDGLDALATMLGLSFFAGLAGVASMAHASPSIAISCLTVIGAFLPFLFLNAPPAKVFMGDVGSLPIGALMGYLVYACAQSADTSLFRSEWTVPGALLILSVMMIIELVPVPLQIASVKLRKKKIFPYTPVHHAFEKAGWPETRVMFMFALAQMVLSALAVTLVAAPSSPLVLPSVPQAVSRAR